MRRIVLASGLRGTAMLKQLALLIGIGFVVTACGTDMTLEGTSSDSTMSGTTSDDTASGGTGWVLPGDPNTGG
jgi:hypothetical protein